VIVVTRLQEFPSAPGFVAVALGNFDGVHQGHQTLIKKLVDRAHKEDGISVVFTFHPHPLKILAPAHNLLLLNTTEEKENLIRRLGVDFFIPFPFTKEIADMVPGEFVQTILLRGLRAKSIFVGYNFTFGRKAAGNPNMLQSICLEQGCEVNIISEVKEHHVTVSSTNIREFLLCGNIKMANLLLGYTYSLFGPVIPGNQVGRQLGFPTANLDVSPGVIIPANGVYAVKVKIDGASYDGVANIGNRPTLGHDLLQSVEIHILDQRLDLYGKSMRVFFIERLRPEKKFSGLHQLTSQIQHDVDLARSILRTTSYSMLF